MTRYDIRLEGFDPKAPTPPEQSLQRLFSMPPEAATRFLRSLPRVVKRDVEESRARRIEQALADVGGRVRLEPSPIKPVGMVAVGAARAPASADLPDMVAHPAAATLALPAAPQPAPVSTPRSSGRTLVMKGGPGGLAAAVPGGPSVAAATAIEAARAATATRDSGAQSLPGATTPHSTLREDGRAALGTADTARLGADSLPWSIPPLSSSPTTTASSRPPPATEAAPPVDIPAPKMPEPTAPPRVPAAANAANSATEAAAPASMTAFAAIDIDGEGSPSLNLEVGVSRVPLDLVRTSSTPGTRDILPLGSGLDEIDLEDADLALPAADAPLPPAPSGRKSNQRVSIPVRSTAAPVPTAAIAPASGPRPAGRSRPAHARLKAYGLLGVVSAITLVAYAAFVR